VGGGHGHGDVATRRWRCRYDGGAHGRPEALGRRSRKEGHRGLHRHKAKRWAVELGGGCRVEGLASVLARCGPRDEREVESSGMRGRRGKVEDKEGANELS
jgi:hypothetical protein